MMRFVKWLISACLMFVPTLSQALELDYYTYNGFDETVSAFTRVALALNDTRFLIVAGVIVMFGIMMGAIVTASKGMAGGGIHPILWMIPIIVGMAIFKGLVMSRGTIHVYDPVRNAYQAVGDVPDLVVAVAGTLNKVERLVVDIVDSTSLRPFADTGGGINYSLMLAASQTGFQNTYLDRSLSRYYKDCGTFAIQAKLNGADEHAFRRRSVDLGVDFGRFTSGAVMTEYWPTDGTPSLVLSCTDAWTRLQAEVNSLANYNDYRQYICRQAGFNAGDAAQMTRCDAQISQAGELYGLAPGPNMVPVLRSFALAHAVTNAMNDPDFTVGERTIVSRNTMIQAEGASQAANQWIPRMRTFMTAMAIGMVPLLVLLIPTPVCMKALGFTLGMFIFITLWGICDATAVAMLDDQAAAAFEQVRQYNLGYDAIMNTPTAAVQSLGVFGKARFVAMGLATAIAGSVFVFGGYAFANQSQHLSTEIEKEGERASTNVQDPAARAGMMGSLTKSMAANEVAMARGGFGTMTADAGQRSMGEMAYRQGMISEQLKTSGDGYSGILAQESARAGSDVGAGEAWKKLGEGVKGGIASKASQTSEYNTSFSTESTLSKRDQERSTTGVEQAARLSGSMQGAQAGTNERLVEEITGTKTPDARGFSEVNTQLRASELGMAQAMGTRGGSESAVEMFKTSNTRQAAHMEELRSSDAAELAGETAGKREVIGARAFNTAEDLVGSRAQQAAATLSTLQDAHRGAAALESGNLNETARDLSRADLARQQASAGMLRTTAEFLGLDDSRMSDLVRTSQMREGAGVRVAAEGDTLDSVLDSLVDRGLMKPEYADALREQGAATFDVALSPNGTPLSVSARAGANTDITDTFNETTGESVSERHTSSYDVSNRVDGKMNLMNQENLATAIEQAFDNIATGDINEGQFAALAAAIGEARGQLGSRKSAHDDHQRSLNFETSAGGSVGGSIGVASGSAGVRTSHGRANNYGQGTTEDMNISEAREDVLTAREQAVAEYNERYGDNAAQTNTNTEEMNQYLAEQTARIVLEKFGAETTARDSDLETARNADGKWEIGDGETTPEEQKSDSQRAMEPNPFQMGPM